MFGLGLGAGFFLAGLILLILPREPAREDVIARARDYGMVFREEVIPLEPEQREKEIKQRTGATVSLPGADGKEEILVTIPAGAGLEDIAALLENKGVAGAAAFAAEVHRLGLEQKLKAGSYYLPAGDIKEIIRRLTT